MMQTRVVSDDGLRTRPTGYSIDVRLPWYRSLPLSVVDVRAVELDGKPIDMSRVSIEINGQQLALSDLRPRTSEVWYVLDSALLHVKAQPLATGSKHDVAVTIAIRPPYIQGFTRITRTSKTLIAH